MIRIKHLHFAVAAICMSLAPCISAQTTLDQQKRTAKILPSGAIESGAGWIFSVTHTTTGLYGLTFAAPFTAPPNCVVSAEAQGGSSNFTNALIISNNPSAPQQLDGITVQLFNPDYSPVDTAFRISCIPDQTVGTSAAAWNAAGTLTAGTDWISSVTSLGVGTYQATFSKPYLSIPVCVATTPANGTPSATIQANPTTTGVRVFTQSINVINLLAVQVATTAAANRPVAIICTGPQ